MSGPARARDTVTMRERRLHVAPNMAKRHPSLPGDLSTIEAIRRRPGMYLGSVEFFGFVNYLVCPVALLLKQKPSQLAIAAEEGGFVVEVDVALLLQETPSGGVAPFEEILELGPGHNSDACIVNALSETLTVEIRQEHQTETLTFRRGIRESRRVVPGRSDGPRTILRFAPDASIFTVTELSPGVFKSYLRRLSYLYQGIRFSLTVGAQTSEFRAERGIVDLFSVVTAPYQLVHEPIHFILEEDVLRIEAVFAYHSWTERILWCFMNNGRAAEGGTHEEGLDSALTQIHRKFKLPGQAKDERNGVIGVVSIHYPKTVWEGCIKAKVGNPELRTMVRDLVVRGTADWLEAHPAVLHEMRHMQLFRFAESWYHGFS